MLNMNALKTKFSRKRRLTLSFFTLLFLILLGVKCCTPTDLPQTEEARFLAYTEELFRQELSGNSLSLHFTLKNPAAYNIVDTPVNLSSYTTDVSDVAASLENSLSVLHTYDKSELSKNQKITYELLESYLTASLKQSKYLLYDEPLAPLTGTQAQFPILLSEYRFYTQKDVDTYLTLLEKTPEYFDSIIAFEQEKSKRGLFMSPALADDIIAECETFINLHENNYLYSSFKNRMKVLDLSKKEKDTYIKKNKEYIEQYIFPSYNKLKQEIKKLRKTGTSSGGLCNLPEGAEYYKFLVESETGSSRSIPELQQLTKQYIAEDLNSIQKALSSISNKAPSPASDLFKSQGVVLEDSNPASILASLKLELSGQFPAPPAVNIQTKYVSKEMEDYLSPAFYLIPAIDNTEENIIYINKSHMTNDLSLYTTLAHEGYPGHLYQTTYFANKNPDPIRNLLNCGGYVEGWATYSEMMSYYFAPADKAQTSLMQKNSSILLGLYALADMGIHFDGWTLTDTVSFFRSYGITDTDTITEIYDIILSDPANYLKYYIGYIEFLELKKEAIMNWGKDFSQKRFHKAVLDVGPAPFDLVRKYIFN